MTIFGIFFSESEFLDFHFNTFSLFLICLLFAILSLSDNNNDSNDNFMEQNWGNGDNTNTTSMKVALILMLIAIFGLSIYLSRDVWLALAIVDNIQESQNLTRNINAIFTNRPTVDQLTFEANSSHFLFKRNMALCHLYDLLTEADARSFRSKAIINWILNYFSGSTGVHNLPTAWRYWEYAWSRNPV